MTPPIASSGAHTVFLDGDALQDGPVADIVLAPVLLRMGMGTGLDNVDQVIRIYSPAPTAAFSRRDSHQRGFSNAVAAARTAGFTPVLRGPGGRLAAYHRGSVVIDHIVRSAQDRLGLNERFELYATMHADVLKGFGLDARVGELEGEYCPGRHSINAVGIAKIVGSAQRVTREGWLFSSVIQATGAAALRDLLIPTHQALGYELKVSTIGAVEDFVPGVTTAAVAEAVRDAYKEAGGVQATLPAPVVQAVQQATALLEAELP
jgi:lipoate-protein ligase A